MINDKSKDGKLSDRTQSDFSIKSMTLEEIESDEKKDIEVINDELKRGFDFIKKYPKSVSFFGSSRFEESNKYTLEAEALAEKIVKELGYAIVTGGGPGIMGGANKGAAKAGGDSLGLTIKLPKEQSANPHLSDKIDFHYFFLRKTMLTFSAEAFIFFPGGFGTLDEFFEILTLVQTNKIPRVPIILIGREFWEPMTSFITSHMIDNNHSITPSDVNLYKIYDSHEEVIETIQGTVISNWWKNF